MQAGPDDPAATRPRNAEPVAAPSAVSVEGAPRQRSRRFFWIRVSVLLAILFGVSLYAIRDYRSRHGRKDWNRTLEISFVVVRAGPVSADALEALKQRVPALEAQLATQMQRYRKSALPPVHVTIRGPVDGAPPAPNPGDGLAEALKYQWRLWRWTKAVDSLADYDASSADSRIYLVVKPPASPVEGRIVRQIEGASEKDGRVGVVSVDLDAAMADFALFVATHELLHTLGATDKYTQDGAIMVPSGLPEPGAFPLYPQRFAEVMARHRAVDATTTKPPRDLGELAVGAETAREIGWLK